MSYGGGGLPGAPGAAMRNQVAAGQQAMAAGPPMAMQQAAADRAKMMYGTPNTLVPKPTPQFGGSLGLGQAQQQMAKMRSILGGLAGPQRQVMPGPAKTSPISPYGPLRR